MKDLSFDRKGGDLKVLDTTVYKAKNLLSTQVGSLYYENNFGIDLKLFFNPDYQIQNATFESYTLERMAAFGINPIDLIKDKNTFEEIYKYTVTEAATGGLIL